MVMKIFFAFLYTISAIAIFAFGITIIWSEKEVVSKLFWTSFAFFVFSFIAYHVLNDENDR